MPSKARKQVRHPPSYYKERSQNLAQQGRTPRPLADTTKKGIQSQLNKVATYCDEIGQDPNDFLKSASVADIKTYFEWVIHRHSRIKAGSSIKNYWRVLKMHMLDKFDRRFTEDDVADVRNYLTVLQKENDLRVHLLPKPVLDKDAVYKLLYILWVIDTKVYPDERQRVQDHGAILLSTFFGCRLTSIFDTRVRLEPWDPNMEERGDNDTSVPTSTTELEADEEGISSENDLDDDVEEDDNSFDEVFHDFGLDG